VPLVESNAGLGGIVTVFHSLEVYHRLACLIMVQPNLLRPWTEGIVREGHKRGGVYSVEIKLNIVAIILNSVLPT
jgi:hypothetical protein